MTFAKREGLRVAVDGDGGSGGVAGEVAEQQVACAVGVGDDDAAPAVGGGQGTDGGRQAGSLSGGDVAIVDDGAAVD